MAAREALVSASASVDDLPASELGPRLADIASLRNQLDALDVAVVQHVRATGEWASDGSRSMAAWIARQSNCTQALASKKASAVKALPHTPELAEAFREGAVSLEHVGVVAAAIRPCSRQEQVGEVDAIFTRLAMQSGPGQLRKAVDLWANRVDAVAVAEGYAEYTDNAYLHVSPILDGMVKVDGMLDPETGQLLIDALKAARERLHPEPDSDSFATGNAQADLRPVSAQNAQALRLLLGLAIGSGKVGNGPSGLPVTLFVTAPLDALQAHLDEADVIPAELVGAGPIPAATARRLACDANVIPAVLDGQSRILDVGTAKRTIPKHLRAAVTARDQHCRFGDCRHPIEEIHHVIFWSHGGPTSLQNLAGLCRAHHHAVHERGWSLTGDANQALTATRR